MAIKTVLLTKVLACLYEDNDKVAPWLYYVTLPGGPICGLGALA